MRAEGRMMRARGTKTRTNKREEIESENPTGSMTVCRRKFRGGCEREKNDGEFQMWERGEREQVLGGRREREGKEREEILSEDEGRWNG
jgi:hypothetical protein